MENLQIQVRILAEDVRSLELEIARELDGESWTEIPNLLEGHGYSPDFGIIRERLTEVIARINLTLSDLLDSLDEDRRHHDPEGAVKATVEELINLQTQLSHLWGRLVGIISLIAQKQAAAAASGPTQATTAPTQAASGWISTIAKWIQGISSQLWQLLCHLASPKEWTLKGEVGTSVVGLAKVGIEIKFV